MLLPHLFVTSITKLSFLLEVSIGFRTLVRCSQQLKAWIAHTLQSIAENDDDTRQPFAAWELSICYFSGFGLPSDVSCSARWLQFAADRGVPAAKTFLHPLHRAMNWVSPQIAQDSIAENFSKPGRDTRGISPMARFHPVEETAIAIVESNDLASNGTSDITVKDFGVANGTDSATDLVPSESLEGGTGHLSEEMIQLVTHGDGMALSRLLEEQPEAAKFRDSEGNTLLSVAAKSHQYELIALMLQQSATETDAYNKLGESPLHILADVTDENQLKALLPRLLRSGMDPYHETVPLHDGELLDFASSFPCDPILRSILQNNLVFLSCLLDSMHEVNTRCRVCEGGSRLRRLVAISLSAFRSDALKVIQRHIQEHQGEDTVVNFNKIEVWSSGILLEISKLPFQSVIVNTLDLPESFFRALTFGDEYKHALESTLSLLLEDSSDVEKCLQTMLWEATMVNSCDGVDFLLAEAEKRGLQPGWWLQDSLKTIRNSPLFLSIKHGHRDIFRRLCDAHPGFLQDFVSYKEECKPPGMIKHIQRDAEPVNKPRRINLVQISLSQAVTASHQDPYF